MVIKGETDMLETFNVLRIDEPDFGCEGRPDGMAVKDNVLLKSNIQVRNDSQGEGCPIV